MIGVATCLRLSSCMYCSHTPSFFLQFNFSFGCILENSAHIFHLDFSIHASTPIAAHLNISLAVPWFSWFFPDFAETVIYYTISIQFSCTLRHIILPQKPLQNSFILLSKFNRSLKKCWRQSKLVSQSFLAIACSG